MPHLGAQPFANASGTPLLRRSSARSLAVMYLFFWYFSGPLQWLIYHADVAGLDGFWQASAASLLWLIPPLLFPRWTRPHRRVDRAGVVDVLADCAGLLPDLWPGVFAKRDLYHVRVQHE
jgi:hypothetical protein